MAVLRVLLTLGLVPRLRDVFVREWAYNDSAQVCPECPKWFCCIAVRAGRKRFGVPLAERERSTTEHSHKGVQNVQNGDG